jgi:hypothetical protein
VRATFITSLGVTLLASFAHAQQPQVTGQPLLLAPAVSAPQGSGHPSAAAKPVQAAAKPLHPAKTPSTPESRSAAALAMSADPVFDEGTYQRIKETLRRLAGYIGRRQTYVGSERARGGFVA